MIYIIDLIIIEKYDILADNAQQLFTPMLWTFQSTNETLEKQSVRSA